MSFQNVLKNFYEQIGRLLGRFSFLVFMGWILFRTAKFLLFLFELGVIELGVVGQVLYPLVVNFLVSVFLAFFIFRRRWLGILYVVVEFVYVCFYLLYFSYSHRYVSLLNLVTLGEGLKAISTLKIVFSWKILGISLLDMPFALMMIFGKKNWQWLREFYTSSISQVLFCGSIALLILNETNNFVHHKSFYHILKEGRALLGKNEMTWQNLDEAIIRRYGTVSYAVFTALSYNLEDRVIALFDYGPEQIFQGKGEKYSIVFIQVENLDSPVLFYSHQGKPIMPFLNWLSTHSRFYPLTVSYHYAGGTSDAEFALINSVKPSEIYPSIQVLRYDYPNSFVKQLKKSGYSTFVFHNNVAKYFGRDRAFPSMGFDEFYDRAKMGLPEKGWGASDEDVFAFVKKKLETEKKPFLYYIITMSSHGPFTYVRNYYTNTNLLDLRENIVKDYFLSLSYVDTQLSNFVSFIMNRFDDVHVVIVGDHSSAIHTEEYNAASCKVGSFAIEFVPLFIVPAKSSHFQSRVFFSNVTSFLDVGPTVLDMAQSGGSIRSYGTSLMRISNDQRFFFFPKGRLESGEILRIFPLSNLFFSR